MNQSQSAARRHLVPDMGPAQCPRCRERVSFTTDSNGCAIERCDCGHKAYVNVRIVAAVGVGTAPLPA